MLFLFNTVVHLQYFNSILKMVPSGRTPVAMILKYARQRHKEPMSAMVRYWGMGILRVWLALRVNAQGVRALEVKIVSFLRPTW